MVQPDKNIQPHFYLPLETPHLHHVQDRPHLDSKIQRLGRHNVPAHLGEGQLELLLELLATHDPGSLCNLSDELLETSEQPDQTALVDIRHFAATC